MNFPQAAFHRLVRQLRNSGEYFQVNEVLRTAFGETVSLATQLRFAVERNESLPVEPNPSETIRIARDSSDSSEDSDDGVEIVFAKVNKPPCSRISRYSEPKLQIFPTHKYSLRAQAILFDALHNEGPYQPKNYSELCKSTRLTRGEVSAWFNCRRRLFKMKLDVETDTTGNYAKEANRIFLENYYKGECNCLGKDCFMNLHIKH